MKNEGTKPNMRLRVEITILIVSGVILSGLIVFQYLPYKSYSGSGAAINNNSNSSQPISSGGNSSATNDSVSTPAKSSQNYIDEGSVQLSAKNYAAAIDLFNQGIALNPQNAKAFAFKSEAQFNLGDKTAAIATLNDGLKYNPNNELLKSKLDVLTMPAANNSNIDALRE